MKAIEEINASVRSIQKKAQYDYDFLESQAVPRDVKNWRDMANLHVLKGGFDGIRNVGNMIGNFGKYVLRPASMITHPIMSGIPEAAKMLMSDKSNTNDRDMPEELFQGAKNYLSRRIERDSGEKHIDENGELTPDGIRHVERLNKLKAIGNGAETVSELAASWPLMGPVIGMALKPIGAGANLAMKAKPIAKIVQGAGSAAGRINSATGGLAGKGLGWLNAAAMSFPAIATQSAINASMNSLDESNAEMDEYLGKREHDDMMNGTGRYSQDGSEVKFNNPDLTPYKEPDPAFMIDYQRRKAQGENGGVQK